LGAAKGRRFGANAGYFVATLFYPLESSPARVKTPDMESRIAKGIGLFALWAFVGTVLSLEAYFNLRVMADYVDFGNIAIPQFGRAAMWAAMVPFILRLRQKVPLSRGHWIGGVAFHFLAAFMVMAVYYLGRMFAGMMSEHLPLSEFWSMAQRNFYGRNMIDMAYYWAVLAFGYSFEIYQKYKSEELKAAQLEARLIETELKALRQQMHPHFLFNTMNTIAVLVREGKNDEAVTLLARLSALLRMTLENTGIPEVTLRQEVEFLERYVEIQKARFSDRLQVNLNIAPDALDARIPNLLLQPMVENAIIHGIAPKNGPGVVEISGRIERGQLHLEVRDDGPGFGPVEGRRREGIGLSNTRERLMKIYGSNQQLVLKSEPGHGVTVQIVLPYRT
jgi:two-component system LytT family sensor kinase